jgi:uncharacterized protein YoxC
MSNDLKVTLSLVDDFTQKLTGIQSRMGAFGKQIDYLNNIAGKFGFGLGIGVASTAVIGGIKDMINTAKEYAQVENQMRESLGYTSIELNKQADELGKKNLVEDKDILTVQQRLSLYTQSEDAIKKLTPAILDYAKATGKDLLTATQTVTRAIESEKGTIKGFPGHLDGVAESTERLSAVTEILNQHFHGQAVAVRNSKNEIDGIGYSLNQLKDTIAISFFGKFEERELLRYTQALDFVEKYSEASESYRKINEESYREDLILIQEYEKKIGDAKTTALKKQQEDAAEAAGKKINLTPGFKSEKDFTKDAKEKQKEAEKAAKELLKTQKDVDNQYLALIHKAEAEEIADMKAKYEIEIDLEKQYLALVHSAENAEVEDKKIRFENELRMEEDKRRAQEETMRGTVSNFRIIAEQWHEFGTAYKIAAEAQNAIDTYKSATAAYSSMAGIPYVGPVLGFAAAAAAITAGVANGAKIASQEFAIGTPYAPGGMALVGERGPERVYLPRGAKVETAGPTMAKAGGAGGVMHIHIHDAQGNVLESATQQIRSRQNADRFVSMVFNHAKKMGLN